MYDVKFSKPFKNAFKKLGKQSPPIVSKITEAIDSVRTNPNIGGLKQGDLKGVRCLDFYHQGANYELAYELEATMDGSTHVVLLLLVGTRENFYKELKRLI